MRGATQQGPAKVDSHWVGCSGGCLKGVCTVLCITVLESKPATSWQRYHGSRYSLRLYIPLGMMNIASLVRRDAPSKRRNDGLPSTQELLEDSSDSYLRDLTVPKQAEVE